MERLELSIATLIGLVKSPATSFAGVLWCGGRRPLR
jgi:hypothetical protein